VPLRRRRACPPRERNRIRRADHDVGFRDEFAAAIREQFPGCPTLRADAIALHAAARGSGRVGKSAAGRALEPEALELRLRGTRTTTACCSAALVSPGGGTDLYSDFAVHPLKRYYRSYPYLHAVGVAADRPIEGDATHRSRNIRSGLLRDRGVRSRGGGQEPDSPRGNDLGCLEWM
jgi:hypothetical protein